MSIQVYPVFPGVKWPIVKSPLNSTLTQDASSGKEYRLSNWPSVRWQFKFDYDYLFDDFNQPNAETNYAAQKLMWFIVAVQGSYQSFLYTDTWNNDVAVPGPGQGSSPFAIGDGNGTQTAFPLWRQPWYLTVNGASVEYLQYVTNLNVYKNGTLVSPSAYTLTQPPAVVTFNTAPGSGQSIAYTCNLQYLCRFTKDTYDFSHIWNGMWQVAELEWMSVLA